jgi:hypothetical protein
MNGAPPDLPPPAAACPDPWAGVALARRRAAADPDSDPRPVAFPAAWPEESAEALAALAPGRGPVLLPRLAEAWIGRAAARARSLGLQEAEAEALASALRRLLLARRGAPGAATWRGEAGPLRFVLNLPAFLDSTGGFDSDAYADAVGIAVLGLEALSQGKAERLSVGIADLAGWLAGLGLRYGGPEALAATAALGALTRGAAEAASGRLAARFGARAPVALMRPPPPSRTAVPGLAEAARAALDAAAAAPGLRHAALLALSPPDAVEALLGAETGGLAPAAGASRLLRDAAGRVVEAPTAAARAAARRLGVDPLGPEVAALLAPPPPEARTTTERALAPWLDAAPPVPAAEAAPPKPARARPAHRPAAREIAVRIGGLPVVLRIEEDARRRPVGLSFHLPTDSAGLRPLLEPLARVLSDAWAQHVSPACFVEAFAHAAIGPGGAVEGDPHIARAASVLDWAARRIGRDYLGRDDLPDPLPTAAPARAAAPLLPLDLPPAPPARRPPRGRALRLAG